MAAAAAARHALAYPLPLPSSTLGGCALWLTVPDFLSTGSNMIVGGLLLHQRRRSTPPPDCVRGRFASALVPECEYAAALAAAAARGDNVTYLQARAAAAAAAAAAGAELPYGVDPAALPASQLFYPPLAYTMGAWRRRPGVAPFLQGASCQPGLPASSWRV